MHTCAFIRGASLKARLTEDMTALVQLLICSIVWELHTSNVSGKRLPSATHTCNYIALPWVCPPSHYTENLIAKLSLSPISDSSLLLPRDGSIVRKEAECKKFSLLEIYPRNCPARRGGRRMSESGTKKGRRLACANDSAGGPNGLKAMWKWRKEGRELPSRCRLQAHYYSSPLSSLFLLTGTA